MTNNSGHKIEPRGGTPLKTVDEFCLTVFSKL